MAEQDYMHIESLEIRDSDESDVEHVLPLLEQLWPDAQLDDVALRAAFKQALSSELGRCLCATIRGKMVGFCTLNVRWSLWQQAPLGHVDELVVDQDYRGKGIGTRLLRRIEAVARQMGCHRIELDSAFHRQSAHAFYERLGYTKRAFVFSKVTPLEA